MVRSAKVPARNTTRRRRAMATGLVASNAAVRMDRSAKAPVLVAVRLRRRVTAKSVVAVVAVVRKDRLLARVAARRVPRVMATKPARKTGKAPAVKTARVPAPAAVLRFPHATASKAATGPVLAVVPAAKAPATCARRLSSNSR